MESVLRANLRRLDNSVLIADLGYYSVTIEPSEQRYNMYYVHCEGLNRIFDEDEVVDFCNGARKITYLDFYDEKETVIYQLFIIY